MSQKMSVSLRDISGGEATELLYFACASSACFVYFGASGCHARPMSAAHSWKHEGERPFRLFT